MIRMGFGCMSYCKYNKELPKNFSNYSGPYMRECVVHGVYPGAPITRTICTCVLFGFGLFRVQGFGFWVAGLQI